LVLLSEKKIIELSEKSGDLGARTRTASFGIIAHQTENETENENFTK
jgi:hypothetical protein